MGGRLPKCSSGGFPHKVEEALPAELREVLLPLVQLVETLSGRIKEYDETIETLGCEKYPHTQLLRQVKGVGPITALAYVLTLEKPERFVKSRDVGPYLGLVPKQEDSGDSQPQLRITKMGDVMVRQLLVGSAHYILGPVRTGYRFKTLRFATEPTRREECQEASRGGGGTKAGCIAAPSMGGRRGL
jgi:transposase